MRFKNNQKYMIANSDYFVLYKDKTFFLLTNNGKFVFEKGYKKILVIYNQPDSRYVSCRHGEILLLLVNFDESASVYDLKKNLLMETNFPFKTIKYKSVEIEPKSFHKEETLSGYCGGVPPLPIPYTPKTYTQDIIFEIKDFKRKIYNYSTERGFIFGPIPQKKIEVYDFGYIVNGHLLHYFSGKEEDLDEYTWVGSNNQYSYDFYVNKSENQLYIFSPDFGLDDMVLYDTDEQDNCLSYHYEENDCYSKEYYYSIYVKYYSDEKKIEVNITRERYCYCDYDILADGFGGDEEAMATCFADGY